MDKSNTTFVGSVVDVYCKDPTKRLEYDRYDDEPMDDQMSFICKPTKKFNLPHYDWHNPIQLTYPRCLGWCPGVKPRPPKYTGLYLAWKDDNIR